MRLASSKLSVSLMWEFFISSGYIFLKITIFAVFRIVDCKYMKRILYILLFVFSPVLIQAQSHERADYAGAAGEKSLLYRGRLAPEYNFRFNGHCYAESKEFLPGSVMYNGRLYENVLLNIDAYADLLLARYVMITALARDYVDYTVIGGRRYVNLNYQGRCKDAPTGFCEELYTAGDLGFYSKITKRLDSDDGYHNGEDIGYYDPDYMEYVKTPTGDQKLHRYFYRIQKYYVVKDGRAVQVKSKRAFLKLFDRQTAAALRRWASEQKLDTVECPFEDYVKRLMAHLGEGAL